MIDTIISILYEIEPQLQQCNITSNSLLSDYGFDSMHMIKLILALENQFNLTVDCEYLLFEYFNSIDAISTTLKQIINRR